MNFTGDSGSGTIKCDPSVENCPGQIDITNTTNSTNATTNSIFDLAVQYNLLAVGGIQAIAGVTTFFGSDSGTTMSLINAFFGTLGVYFGLEKFFEKQRDTIFKDVE